MSEHVLDWISAYHDGELHGERRRRVEEHLRGCTTCQAELEALRGLTAHLQASPPMAARTPPEQFVAQVRLRLPPRRPPVPGRERLRRAAGLWLPLGVLALWALGEAALAVGGLALAVAEVPPLLLSWLEGWRGWLGLLALNAGLTSGAAVLAWGCLAGWWAAGKTYPAPAGEQAGG